MPNGSAYPIIYVRGFAGGTSGIDTATDDPFYGFNDGATHVRVNGDGNPQFYQFEGPLVRLMEDEDYRVPVHGNQHAYLNQSAGGSQPRTSVWIYRFYDPAADTFGAATVPYDLPTAARNLLAFVQLVLAIAHPALDGSRWPAGLADNTTATVIALLSLIAIAVLGYGLVRAIAMNRRSQIILAELTVPAGNAELADAVALSPVARQCVQRQINDQRAQIARIGREVLAPASAELELRIEDAVVDQVQHAARDSIGTLLAALRAVTPDTADRFLGLFSAILPPPRGVSVGLALIQRGADATRRIGVSVEIIRLDGHPFAAEIFWEPESRILDIAVREAGNTERILDLLEPVSRWIAVRLVSALMVSPRRRVKRPERLGLGHLLVGGLFLQAMRDFPDQALTFGEQACTELERARQPLSPVLLPVTTLAAVHERLGWARQRSGQPAQATDSFRTAANLWRDAEKITRDAAEPDEAKLATYLDRRLKAELESGDLVLRRTALAELGSVSEPEALLGNRVWLYNRACLYSQASKADSGAGHQECALLWLGLALRFYEESGMWEYAAQRDPELEPIRSVLRSFLACLRTRMPSQPGQLAHVEARRIVAQAISDASA